MLPKELFTLFFSDLERCNVKKGSNAFELVILSRISQVNCSDIIIDHLDRVGVQPKDTVVK